MWPNGRFFPDVAWYSLSDAFRMGKLHFDCDCIDDTNNILAGKNGAERSVLWADWV